MSICDKIKMVRVKRRYIVLAVEYQKTRHGQEAFLKQVRDRVGEMFGDFGLACIKRGFSIKHFDPHEGIMILTVKKGAHEMVMSILATITTVESSPCNVRIIHLSGTMRGCFKVMKKMYLMNLRASIAKTMAVKTRSVESGENNC